MTPTMTPAASDTNRWWTLSARSCSTTERAGVSGPDREHRGRHELGHRRVVRFESGLVLAGVDQHVGLGHDAERVAGVVDDDRRAEGRAR